MARGVLPTRKRLVYREKLPFFEGLDALVVSERTALLLKTRYRMRELPIPLADHGAGDRANGYTRTRARRLGGAASACGSGLASTGQLPLSRFAPLGEPFNEASRA